MKEIVRDNVTGENIYLFRFPNEKGASVRENTKGPVNTYSITELLWEMDIVYGDFEDWMSEDVDNKELKGIEFELDEAIKQVNKIKAKE